jgi:hypothetical protein
MRHTTRRRGRGRRARLTRRQRLRHQRGGASGCKEEHGGIPILGTEGTAAWLKEVFNVYASSPRITPPLPTTPEGAQPPRTDPAIRDLQLVPFTEPEDPQRYILPAQLSCDAENEPVKAVFPSIPEEKALYDMRGNYGRIIRAHVLSLMQQPTYRGFGATVTSFPPEEAQTGAVSTLLAIENMLRTLLRAVLTEADIKTYSHIAENIRSLDDIYTYPLYVWAVARAVEENDATAEGAEDNLLPLLVPEAEVKAMMTEALAQPTV